MKSSPILQLLQKREDLLKQLNDINSRIIRLTLDHGADSVPLLAALAGRGAGAAAAPVAAARGGRRRKWFERGEMIKLARKLLAKPMTQADLVRGLAAAKGYDKSLPAAEQARFKSAAYQAIAAALSGKQLLRNKLGQVSARR